MYQDKKEQVQNHQKKTPFQVLFLFLHQNEEKASAKNTSFFYMLFVRIC